MKNKFRNASILAVLALSALNGCVTHPAYVERTAVVAQPEIIVSQAPPPPPRDIRVPAPGDDYVWVPGYWSWNGGWVWIRGSWVHRPYRHAKWVPGHWRHHHHQYTWVPGYWH